MSLFYQSESLEIISKGGNYLRVPSLDSLNIGLNINRNTQSRLGSFAPSDYRSMNEWPTASLSFSYSPHDKEVETFLGLTGSNSIIDFLVSDTHNKQSLDYRVFGRDLFGNSDNRFSFFLQSGVITEYSFQASAGQSARSSVNIECLDLGIDSESFVPQETEESKEIIKSQNMSIDLPKDILGIKNLNIQNFVVRVPLNRSSTLRIGDTKPFSRRIQSPVIANIQIEGFVGEYSSTDKRVNSKEIENIVRGSPIEEDIIIDIYSSKEKENKLMSFKASRPYLEDYSLSNSVGGNSSVNFQFSVPVSFERGNGLGNLTIN